jgi:hypothetical protein
MTDFDGYEDEMGWNSDIHASAIDRLFAGKTPGDSDFAEVSEFLDELDRTVPESSTTAMGRAHIAQMLQASQQLVERSVSEQPTSEPTKLRRLDMLKNVWAHRWAKVATIAVASLLALGGTAYAAGAGALPNPVQDAVSAAAQPLGIDVPTAAEADQPDVQDVNQNDQGNVDEQAADQADETDVEATDTPDATVDQNDQSDQNDQGNVDEQNVEQAKPADTNDEAQPQAAPQTPQPEQDNSGSGAAGESD